MNKVSVIIPVYNIEKYLEQCLYSVITQTLKDIEIIIVDDGSTDSSPQICDKFAGIDKRIKVVHKENAGLGIAYNTGMDIATGEYIGFVESDDFADEHMFEDLYELAKKHQADIVKSSWYYYNTSGNIVSKELRFAGYDSYKPFNIINSPNLLIERCSVWSAIYKTDFIRNNNIRYLETPGASYQDVGFTYKALCQTKKMLVTPNAYYYYRQDNENSSINSKEKSEVIFWEYDEVDMFFDSHPEIKVWANDYKLKKQFNDYSWNYHRIADHLKPTFIQHFASDFKKYLNKGELNLNYYNNDERYFLNLILSFV